MLEDLFKTTKYEKHKHWVQNELLHKNITF